MLISEDVTCSWDRLICIMKGGIATHSRWQIGRIKGIQAQSLSRFLVRYNKCPFDLIVCVFSFYLQPQTLLNFIFYISSSAVFPPNSLYWNLWKMSSIVNNSEAITQYSCLCLTWNLALLRGHWVCCSPFRNSCPSSFFKCHRGQR